MWVVTARAGMMAEMSVSRLVALATSRYASRARCGKRAAHHGSRIQLQAASVERDAKRVNLFALDDRAHVGGARVLHKRMTVVAGVQLTAELHAPARLIARAAAHGR